jgi:hypothetical protein
MPRKRESAVMLTDEEKKFIKNLVVYREDSLLLNKHPRDPLYKVYEGIRKKMVK